MQGPAYCDILNCDIFDGVKDALILSEAPNGYTRRVDASEVLYVHIR